MSELIINQMTKSNYTVTDKQTEADRKLNYYMSAIEPYDQCHEYNNTSSAGATEHSPSRSCNVSTVD